MCLRLFDLPAGSLSLRAVAIQIHAHLWHIMCVGFRCDKIKRFSRTVLLPEVWILASEFMRLFIRPF